METNPSMLQRSIKRYKHFRLTNTILLNFLGCIHNHPKQSQFIARWHGNQQRRI